VHISGEFRSGSEIVWKCNVIRFPEESHHRAKVVVVIVAAAAAAIVVAVVSIIIIIIIMSLLCYVPKRFFHIPRSFSGVAAHSQPDRSICR
jgi:hypothetical protein